MENSISIDSLRPDVAANAKIFVAMMAAKGYPVAFASVYRDDEEQARLYAKGRTTPGQIVTGSKVTTFHGVRLAFDIYQDAPTYAEQWQDAGFWTTARKLLTLIGFSRISGEESHSQWSDGGKYSGTQVRAGTMPPIMPLYKGDDFDMYIEEIAKKANVTTAAVVDALAAYVKHANTVEDQWEDKAVQQLRADGVISSDHPGNAPVFWGEFATVVSKIK